MRKKIISFLNKYKVLKWLLVLFHVFIGRNSFRMKGSISIGNSNVYRTKIQEKRGKDNKILIGNNTDLTNSTIIIKGSHNNITLGDDSFINGLTIIVEGDNNTVLIENNVFILDDTRVYVVDGSKLKIENGCMLSDRIDIRTTDNHSIFDKSNGKRINYEKDVLLHNNVWIGTGVTLLKGVELAEGCIVGAGSIITKKCSNPNCIIAGNPGKIIRENISWKMERVKK